MNIMTNLNYDNCSKPNLSSSIIIITDKNLLCQSNFVKFSDFLKNFFECSFATGRFLDVFTTLTSRRSSIWGLRGKFYHLRGIFQDPLRYVFFKLTGLNPNYQPVAYISKGCVVRLITWLDYPS